MTVVQMILETKCDGEQARTLEEAKALIERQAVLLREYLEIAEANLRTWEGREGDESDAMVRAWENKIKALRQVLAR